MVSMWEEGATLRVCALEPRGKTCLTLLLKHEHWLQWGFGPLPWLSNDQKSLLARRLVTVLYLTSSKDAENIAEEYLLAANFAPIIGYSGGMSVADAGTALILSWPKKDNKDDSESRNEVFVSARDLKASCPSLQIDPFQASAASASALAAPGVACGLGPLRFPLASKRLRPGYGATSLAADDADCGAAWEEVRLTAGLRDLEPLPRRALVRRAVLSLQQLSKDEEGAMMMRRGEAPSPLWLSYPPAMPSATCEVKVTLLTVAIDAPKEEITMNVTIAPPVPLWSTGSALDACTLRLSANSRTEVEVASTTRGLMQNVKLEDDYYLGSIWDTVAKHRVEVVGEPSSREKATLLQEELDSSGLVHALVVVLQHQAGKQQVLSTRVGTPFPSGLDNLFPPRPLRVHLHDVTATFVRTPPLQLSCFDTGFGILITAKERPGGYEQITSEEMSAARRDSHASPSSSSREKGEADLEEQQRFLEAASASAAALTSLNRHVQDAGLEDEDKVVLAEYEVPRAKLPAREPLLMTSSELERLMLGYTSKAKWRERRHGMRRCDFLSLTLDAALFGDRSPDEGAPGLAQWAAPFRGGSALMGTVTRVHEDGMVKHTCALMLLEQVITLGLNTRLFRDLLLCIFSSSYPAPNMTFTLSPFSPSSCDLGGRLDHGQFRSAEKDSSK